MVGVVTSVRLNKGFAFVRGVEDRLPRFVYSKDVVPRSAFDTMHEGQRVTFVPEGILDTNPEARHNGLKALQVQCD